MNPNIIAFLGVVLIGLPMFVFCVVTFGRMIEGDSFKEIWWK